MKGYSLPGEGRRRNKVRIQKETYQPRPTHSLQDCKGRDKSGHGKNPTDRGPLTSWRPQREGQVRTRKEFDRPRPTHRLETAQGGTSQDTKNPTDRGPLTHWRPHREGQVRTRKESDRQRPTHVLETAQGGTSQETQRIRPTEAHSQTVDHTGRDKSGHAKNPTD